MRSSILITLTSVAVASCFPGPPPPAGPPGHAWKKPGPMDSRGPCPMLNSLANHGFIPHSGKNVSVDQLVAGMDQALNLSPASSRPVAELGATTSTTGNPNTLNLADLAAHGVIEHDGSLSRNDIFFGNNKNFNPAIFATYFANYAGKSTITIPLAAQARRARVAAARAVNPSFVFTDRDDERSRFETSLFLATFGVAPEWKTPKEWVRVLFSEERLPYKEGFQRSAAVITNNDLVDLATRLITA